MEKEKLKQPYENARLDVLNIRAGDVIATSGDLGDSFGSDDSWT